jgi:hypothetical protein
MSDGSFLLPVLIFVFGYLLGASTVWLIVNRFERERAYLLQVIGRQQQVLDESRMTIPEEEM